jgi:predicted acetyltransferase
VEIRRAHIDDEPQLTQLSRYVHSADDESTTRIRRRIREFIEEFYVAESNGDVVAKARLIPFEQNIRQVRKKMGGVASVVSAPETRRRGNIRKLLIRMMLDMRDEGFSFSTLLPFRADFFAPFGYVKASPWRYLIFNPSHIRERKMPQDFRIRRGKIEDTLTDIREVHSEANRTVHGSVTRNDRLWKEKSIRYDSDFAVVLQGSTPQGYLHYTTTGYGDFDETTRGRMYVREWYWLNQDARDSLLNFISHHSDQVSEVSLPVQFSDNDFYHWLDIYNTVEIKMQADSLHMARCIDVEALLEGIPVEEANPVRLRINDPLCKPNNQTYLVTSNDGKLSAQPMGGKSADAIMTIEGLQSFMEH